MRRWRCLTCNEQLQRDRIDRRWRDLDVKAGISDDVIIEKVHKSGQTFDLSADDMVRLKNAKASDA